MKDFFSDATIYTQQPALPALSLSTQTLTSIYGVGHNTKSALGGLRGGAQHFLSQEERLQMQRQRESTIASKFPIPLLEEEHEKACKPHLLMDQNRVDRMPPNVPLGIPITLELRFTQAHTGKGPKA